MTIRSVDVHSSVSSAGAPSYDCGKAPVKRSAVNRITVRGTDGTERTYTLHGGTLVIGRDPGCGICLEDAQVSWQHAVLSHDGGACVIEDLGSSNGTFLGAERIRRQVFNAGEVVRIGPYELTMQMQAAPSPTSA